MNARNLIAAAVLAVAAASAAPALALADTPHVTPITPGGTVTPPKIPPIQQPPHVIYKFPPPPGFEKKVQLCPDGWTYVPRHWIAHMDPPPPPPPSDVPKFGDDSPPPGYTYGPAHWEPAHCDPPPTIIK